MRSTEDRPAQAVAAEALWEHRNYLPVYARRDLRPVEVMLLVRYREDFARRVLELGSGGGRVTGYLAELAERAVGLDISPKMVEHCRRTYPAGEFEVGDLRDLSRYDDGSFDVVFPTFNVISVLDHAERGRALDEIHRILAPEGLLILSSHNRATGIPAPSVRTADPIRFAIDVLRLPGRRRNHRRLLPSEHREDDYAILADASHDYRGLHYYVSRDAGARNLVDHGFDEIECLDLDGHAVATGEDAAHSSELHFVARRV